MLRGLFSGPEGVSPIVIIIVGIWSLFWKAIALWRSAQNNQRYWYVVLLLLSTAGILEIIYLARFQALRSSKKN